jgi:type I restriction-modification system DNA methylase subunit
MHWVAPSEKGTASATLEKRLWDAADPFRANSGLNAQEYSEPGLGLIFLRFAEVRFAAKRAQLESPSPLGGERAGVTGDSSHPRPSDGRGAGGEGYSGDPCKELSILGVEKADETVRLCRSHLAFAN